MDPAEESVLAIAELVRDSAAMGDAALAGDFDEARLRAQLIEQKAHAAGLPGVAEAAALAIERLGPVGTLSHAGYGKALYRVARSLDVIRLGER